jgi:hypothetical protein
MNTSPNWVAKPKILQAQVLQAQVLQAQADYEAHAELQEKHLRKVCDEAQADRADTSIDNLC